MSTDAAPRWRTSVRQLWRQGLDYLPDVLAFAGALTVAALAALLAAALPGCGGGVGSEGTGSYASGPITGFGSIIVNDIHFDESAARVVDDDDQVLDRNALALGMTVQVTAGPTTTDAAGTTAATASQVRAVRALVGPVSAIDVAAGRLTLLGQTVQVDTGTVVDAQLGGGAAALAALVSGRRVEVYGSFDAASGRYVATRVALADAASGNRVQGPVGAVDAASQTFTIGGQRYSYAALGSAAAPTVGSTVRVLVQAQPDDGGRWLVSGRPAEPAGPGSGSAAALRGRVDSMSDARHFVVDGVSVDAAGATLSGTVAVGARVQVSGTWSGSTLVASRVSVDSSSGSGGSAPSFELSGALASLDRTAQRFVLRNTTVSYARTDLVVEGGTLADLAVGRKVQVQGQLSDDRTIVVATRLRFVN